MRMLFLGGMLFLFISVSAQRKTIRTHTFSVISNGKTEQVYTLAALDSFVQVRFTDVPLTNQLGEAKETLKNLKGILLKNILAKTVIAVDKPKFLNEYYFILQAADGYRAVFSWNELFNTDIGNGVYLITEINGKTINEQEESILCISTKDLASGRRYIRGLDKIIISRAAPQTGE